MTAVELADYMATIIQRQARQFKVKPLCATVITVETSDGERFLIEVTKVEDSE